MVPIANLNQVASHSFYKNVSRLRVEADFIGKYN